MKESRNYIIPGLWLLAAGGLFAAAGYLLPPRIEQVQRDAGLVEPDLMQAESSPQTTLLTMLPGGLRAPALAYLWIRAEDMKQKGRRYDAMQLAQLICQLQPHFSGAWAFQAWNMAYNISVQTHTEEERWRWVYNGIKLLRDQGIRLNPQSIALYRELSWIYFHKMGGIMDDFHRGYKRRWAALMQHLLTPPLYGTTEEAIAAFRPIAEAPLDKDPRRQGGERIQADQLALLLQKDPGCAAYAALLRAEGVEINERLLNAYTHFSTDENVLMTRPGYAPAAEANDPVLGPIAALINAPRYAAPRAKLLAFVRAQMLWNVYRLDPQWMLGLMELYGPLDWRLPWSHAVYWATYGLHAARGTPMESMERFETLNDARDVVLALKDLTWQGRVVYEDDPNNPDTPILVCLPDYRLVEPTQQAYLRYIEKYRVERPTDVPEDNAFRAGHMNYLAYAVQMLYVLDRREQAASLLQYLKDAYKLKGGIWDMGLDDFVVGRMNEDKSPGREATISQVGSAVQTAYVRRVQGDAAGYRFMMGYAQRIYELYRQNVPERNWQEDLPLIEAAVMRALLINPWAAGYNIPLVDRSRLWGLLEPRVQTEVYRYVAPALRRQCRAAGIDFARAFPAPKAPATP